MQWTDDDPGTGDLSNLERLARQLREREDHASEMVKLLTRSGMGMAEYWSGDAADEWADRIRDDVQHYTRLNETAENECGAVLLYVDMVQNIKQRVGVARGLLGQGQDAQDKLTKADDSSSGHQSRIDAAAEDIAAARSSLKTLAEERREADHQLCTRLCSLSEAVRTSAPVSAFDGSLVRSLSPAGLLSRLARLDQEEVAAVLDEHPELVSRLESAAPAAVAAWWESLSPAQQDKLIESAPQLIGNLDGVAFASRDAANRITLASELVRGESDLAAMKKHNSHIAPIYQWKTDELEERLKALRAVRDASQETPDREPRLILILDLLDRPKAAISVGDPDTASQVTVNVPGMGTTVGGSMPSWTEAASNLFVSQKKANALYNGKRETGLACVAWIGYDAPDMPPSAQVLGMGKAREGGARLSRFLDGVSATRDWHGGENLSIVAHSYGTPTAAVALRNTRVETFTMLASAGLAEKSVKQLRVPPSNVWATLAEGDQIADMGRGVVTLWQLPAWTVPSTHRTDPTVPKFGGNVFSSEDAVVSRRKLRGSDGHSATAQIDAILEHRVTTEYGYLDANTTPLFNASLTSLGLGSSGSVIQK